MDNDDAIIGTILSRRETFALLGKAGASLALGGLLTFDAEAAFQAQAHRAVKLVASPALTEGPFFVDEKLNRSNLVGDTKRRTVVEAAPLALRVKIYRLADGKYAPMKGAMVDLWCADAGGAYSDEPQGMNPDATKGESWLRGYQLTDAEGLVEFKTIVPAWYNGRTPHIHFKIRPTGTATKNAKEFTSQFFFDDKVADEIFKKAPYTERGADAPMNRNDMVYRERQVDGTLAGDHMLLDLQPNPKGEGYRATFTVALTESSFRAGGHRGPGGPGGPPPGGFGGPPPDWP